MHSRFARTVLVLTALFVSHSLTAQQPVATDPVTPQPPDDAASYKAMIDALNLRIDAAAAILQGTEAPAATVLRLKAIASPMGLNLNPDADFGIAAMDIGQRVLVAGKPVEAELLFRESEKSLTLAITATPDTKPVEKAMYLAHLSSIRGSYLNNAAQAKADLEQAIALQPDNKALKQALAYLSYSHADLLLAASQAD